MTNYGYTIMNLKDSKNIVRACIVEITDDEIKPTDEMSLIGKDATLDSMKLVELCLALEDKATDLKFEFDWTSETAMSKSRSLFRTVSSLAEEFHAQSQNVQ
jgi:acyl carrier protein